MLPTLAVKPRGDTTYSPENKSKKSGIVRNCLADPCCFMFINKRRGKQKQILLLNSLDVFLKKFLTCVCFLQEKFVQEALARQMPPVSLAAAGAMYPGLPMPMYGATPGVMPPMMHHVAPVTPPQAPSSSSKSGDESDSGGNYVQQLQKLSTTVSMPTSSTSFHFYSSFFYF